MRSIADGGNCQQFVSVSVWVLRFQYADSVPYKGILRSTVLAILASKKQGDYLNTTTRERPLKPEEFV